MKPIQHLQRQLHYDRVAAHVRGFLQQGLQPSLQFAVAIALCSLLVFIRSLTFPLACLAGVYVVVLHLQQARNQHVGTLLLSSSGMLGAVWLGVLTAGVLATIALQAQARVVQLTVLTVLSSIVFAVYGIVKVTPMPVRLTLQGANLMIAFGMSVVLTLFAPNVYYLWSTFLGHLTLAFTACALASSLVGIIVLPSFATEAAMDSIITALRRTGQASTMCVSILLRPNNDSKGYTGATNGRVGLDKLQQQQKQQQRCLPADTSQPPAAAEAAASRTCLTASQSSARQDSSPSRDLSPSAAEAPVESSYMKLQGDTASFGSRSSVTSAQQITAAAAVRASQSMPLSAHASMSLPTVNAEPLMTATAASTTADGKDVVIDCTELPYSSKNDTDLQLVQQTSKCDLPVKRGSSSTTRQRRQRHYGSNLLKQLSHTQNQQRQQQQQQQLPVVDQQQMLVKQLSHRVHKIRPHLLQARRLQDAVAVEQAWWVRFMVGGVPVIDSMNMQDWQALINALDTVIERVAALEGVLEAGPGQESPLASCPAFRSTCGLIFAQTAALCGSFSVVLQVKLQQRQQQQGLISKLLGHCTDLRSQARSSGSPCPMLEISWEAARQQLAEMQQAEMQQLFSKLASDPVIHSDQAKIELTRPAIKGLFLCILGFGLIEAAEKLQRAGQKVLYGRQKAAAAAAIKDPTSLAAALPVAVAAAAGAASLHPAANVYLLKAPTAAGQAEAGLLTKAGPIPAPPPAAAAAPGIEAAVVQPSSRSSRSGTSVMLDSLLCLSLFRRLRGPLSQQLPAALASKQAFHAMLHKRRFQAGIKLWFVSSVGLAAMVLMSVYWPIIPPNIMMVSLKAIVFSMKERVEASTEMMIMRVVSTIFGVCIGQLLMFNPLSADQPWGLAATLLFFGLVIPPFTSGQYSMMLCLGLITLNSTVLCQYVGCCGKSGSLDFFIGRMAGTAGGALFSMLFNRLVLPWERDSWALEEVSQVLGMAVTAAVTMYHQEWESLSILRVQYGGGGGGAAAGVSSRSPGTAVAVVNTDYIAVPVTPLQQQQQLGVSQPDSVRPEVHISKLPATNTSLQAPNSSKASQQQQQRQQQSVDPGRQLTEMKVTMAPVLLAVQRDTWMKWKWGELAVPPIVPKALSAVQQLSDALAALKVTKDHQQHPHHQQQRQQQQDADSHQHPAPAAAQEQESAPLYSSGSSSSSSSNPLLPIVSVHLLHNSILKVFAELHELVMLVQQQVRSPAGRQKDALKHKVAQIEQLLRVTRLEKADNVGPRLDTVFHQHQQQQQQQQQQQGDILQQEQEKQQQPTESTGYPKPMPMQVDCVSLQYLSFVYALRCVFKRVVAVAACLAEE